MLRALRPLRTPRPLSAPRRAPVRTGTPPNTAKTLILVLVGLLVLGALAGLGVYGKGKGWFGGEEGHGDDEEGGGQDEEGDAEDEEGDAEDEEGGGGDGADGAGGADEGGEEGDPDAGEAQQQQQQQQRAEEQPKPKPVRYIRFEATRNQALHLLEIEVYDGSTSRIPAEEITPTLGPQHGTEEDHGPALLLDQDFRTRRIAHTAASPQAFMQLDLGRDRAVTRVILYNRVDCCADAAVGAKVVLRNDAGEEVCGVEVAHSAARYRVDVTPEGCTLLPQPTFPV